MDHTYTEVSWQYDGQLNQCKSKLASERKRTASISALHPPGEIHEESFGSSLLLGNPSRIWRHVVLFFPLNFSEFGMKMLYHSLFSVASRKHFKNPNHSTVSILSSHLYCRHYQSLKWRQGQVTVSPASHASNSLFRQKTTSVPPLPSHAIDTSLSKFKTAEKFLS